MRDAGGKLLEHMTTIEVAKDMDSIRKALGSEQINYYGFSYGTYLGQVYGTMFPDRFRRVVFDGNVDPRQVWYDSNIDQDIAFDKNIKIYWEWVAKYDSIYHLGNTAKKVEKLYYPSSPSCSGSRPRARSGRTSGPTSSCPPRTTCTAGRTWRTRSPPGSTTVTRPACSTCTRRRVDDNSHAVYLAVICTDAKWVTNYNRYRLDNWITHIKAPFTTWGNAWFNGPCLFWPGKSERPLKIDGRAWTVRC